MRTEPTELQKEIDELRDLINLAADVITMLVSHAEATSDRAVDYAEGDREKLADFRHAFAE